MPSLIGRGLTRSMWRSANRVAGGTEVVNSARVCCWILEAWQGWHSLHHC